jgi:hypothetical protein
MNERNEENKRMDVTVGGNLRQKVVSKNININFFNK